MSEMQQKLGLPQSQVGKQLLLLHIQFLVFQLEIQSVQVLYSEAGSRA
jgi:hypothetical protein